MEIPAKMGATGKSFLQFQISRRADLRRIAGSTGGDYTEDDACSEAWLIASEIGSKRGRAVDFSNNDDQDLVLAWLYKELVDFSEKHIRFAVKLDRDWDSDDSESTADRLDRLLATPESLDPLFLVQESQSQEDPLVLVRFSYSQAAAYLILLHRFGGCIKSLSGHLKIVVATLHSRIDACIVHLKNQHSLFDRIQEIEYNFVPTVAREVFRAPIQIANSQQLGWDFG